MLSRYFLFVAVVLAGCTPLSAAEIRVIDGGTLTIDGRTLHLNGIDAPALDAVCTASDGSKWPCGSRARDELVNASKLDEMICKAAKPQTVVCRVAGLDVGALLVKEGLAKAAGDYQALEERARAAKVGIWH